VIHVRVLLLSDIHGNLEALEAGLAAAPAHDLVANLGDIVGYGACPNEVIARARAENSIFVRGNHDKACAGLTDLKYFNPVAGLAVLWTQRTLTPENLEWLRALPQGPLLVEGLPQVRFAHGSPVDEDEYLILPNDAVVPLVDSGVPVVFFGHTHIQGGFCLDAGDPRVLRPVYRQPSRLEKHELLLQQDVRYLINPGSIGQPRDGDPRAAFALFDSEANSVTFFRAPYDVALAQRRIREAGLPERLAIRLAEGR
jgi:diadenosine tetraphosphatase ApaH/serine/threonine PP2A family protein phosphatase